jgi:transglutaminase-like putative cysteine protease
MLPSTAFAKQYVTEENFDYEWYLEKYPDLAAIVDANDKETIWQFYLNVGEPAGWYGRIDPDTLVTKYMFDYEMYAYENQDVAAVLGVGRDALYDHYVNYGKYEGRNCPILSSYSESIEAQRQIYSLADSLTQNCSTDREKVKAIHDWMVKNIKYDIDNYNADTIPSKSYSYVGAILYKTCVCQGYAETFQYFMDVLGIECETITGNATNSSGVTGGHAWNRVKLDGIWYYIDVTWDDPVPDNGNSVYWYKYYLVTDPTFGGNHTASK